MQLPEPGQFHFFLIAADIMADRCLGHYYWQALTAMTQGESMHRISSGNLCDGRPFPSAWRHLQRRGGLGGLRS